jgi:acid phosphatase
MLLSGSLAIFLLLETVLAQKGAVQLKRQQFSTDFNDGNNLLKYFGGAAPYSTGTSNGVSRETPDQCAVDQVFLLHRHGERFEDPGSAADMNAAYEKLFSFNVTHFTGDLEFVNTWVNFQSDPNWWSFETATGPYSGLKNGFDRGTEYAARYGHLWDGQSPVPIFSSGTERVVMTARRFGEGFFGYNYSDVAQLQIIPEDLPQGANSLTPQCYTPSNSVNWSYLNFTQYGAAADRFNSQNPGLNMNATDIYYLMNLAPYELAARPYSPWADAFTLDEWTAFSYSSGASSLSYYYGSGPGSNTSRAIGSVLAGASLKLLNQGPEEAGSLYFSFTHDGNITPVLAALDIFVPEHDLPLDSIPFQKNGYNAADFVCMGGHLTIERLACNKTSVADAGTYVRLIVNEAVVPLDDCQDGPGYSCSLTNYTDRLNRKLENYTEICQPPADYPQNLTFYWNYNHSSELNFHQGYFVPQEYFVTWNDTPILL